MTSERHSSALVVASVPIGSWVRAGIAVALLTFVYWTPICQSLVARWLNDPNWSHGWLIPVFSMYFVYARWDQLSKIQLRGNYLGALILVASLSIGFYSSWWARMGYPQAISIVGAVFGLVLLLGGWSLIRITWFPICYLLLAVPLPNRVYVEFTRPLRKIASWAAATIMPIFSPGLYTEAQAVVIDYALPGRKPGTLNVEEACSGMRLLMAIVALGVALAYLGDRPLWQRVVMILLCLPIAVFCNVIRVSTTGLLYIHGYESLASGTPHQVLGLIVFAMALGMFLLVGFVLANLFVVDEGETTDNGLRGKAIER